MTEADPHSQFDALVLAAGAGRRFGGGKLLAAWGAAGAPLIEAALAAAFAAPVRSVRLVWGADPRVPLAARHWVATRPDAARLRLVEAHAHGQGLSASLKAGLADLPGDSHGVLVFLGDMPRIPVAVLTPLAGAIAGGALAAAPWFQGRRGHPVALAPSLFERLARLEGDQGAGPLLKDLGDAVARISAPDDGVLFDVDQPQDLRRPSVGRPPAAASDAL